MNARTEELLKIANDLSNEDVCTLIEMLGDRVEVFLGTNTDGHMVCSEIESACLNGCSVQLNLTDEMVNGKQER